MLIILLYIRAEKEGEWVLHLEATKKMLPYFFAAGHHNYARYATKKFQKGLHVARLSDGYFNGLWSDMLIETTLIRFGSSPQAQGGLVGITLQPNSVIRWAYSFHKLSMMIKDFKELYNHSLDKLIIESTKNKVLVA